MSYLANRTDAVRYASDWLATSKPDSVLTMIIQPDTSEDYSVRIVTDASSEDIARSRAQAILRVLTNTSPENTPAG